MPNFANPDVSRAAEKETQNRIIGLICPFLPPRVFVKCPSIRKMDGRGGGDRIVGLTQKDPRLCGATHCLPNELELNRFISRLSRAM